MKRIIYLGIAFLVMSGCKKLDLNPKNNLTAPTFYKTADDAKAAVGACYDEIRSIYASAGGFLLIDLSTTDDGVPFLAGVSDRVPLWQYKLTPSNSFINVYDDSYSAIQKCNIVIERILLIDMDANIKNQYVAEAKYIRALNYFNLVRTYGGVPIVTAETRTLKNLDIPRASVEDVYKLIEQDLKDAEVLPVTHPIEKGRATRGSAKGLLSKVYLTRAGKTAGSPFWAMAAAKAKEVMDLNVYDLWANYADAFALANKGGKEFVFEVQYKTDVLGTSLGRLYGVRSAPIYVGGGAGIARVTPSLYNIFSSADKRRDVNFLSTYTYQNKVFPLTATNPDPTKAVGFNKLWDQTATSGSGGGKSFPYMRYSEILLIYAEALNEANNGPNLEAYNAYRKVRERAGLTASLLTNLTYATFKQSVLTERRLEFPFEIQRRFDLVRTGQLIDAVNSETTFNRNPEIKDFHYLLPIPQSVRNSSPSVIQNPGYE